MFSAGRSTTAALALDEVITRLAQRDAVEGIVLIGSAATGTLHDASDYDLLIVLSHSPVPLRVGMTTIDGRLTDLVFVTSEQLDAVLQDAPRSLHADTWEGRQAEWLCGGKVVFDRAGRVTQAQKRARRDDLVAPPTEHELHGRWNRANYNLIHTRRYLSSDDPVY